MSPKPLPLEELKAIAEIDSRLQTKALLDELIYFYKQENRFRNSGVSIGYQMRVKEEYEDKVKHFAQDSMFSRGVMKTLALIAYKQPINQSLVVAYRNNKAYDHLKILLEAGFVKENQKVELLY